MSVLIGKDKKSQRRIDRDSVLATVRERIALDRKRKEAAKEAAKEKESAKEAENAARGGRKVPLRGRKATAMPAADAAGATGSVVGDENAGSDGGQS